VPRHPGVGRGGGAGTKAEFFGRLLAPRLLRVPGMRRAPRRPHLLPGGTGRAPLLRAPLCRDHQAPLWCLRRGLGGF